MSCLQVLVIIASLFTLLTVLSCLACQLLGQMSEEFEKGDKVAWSYAGGKTEGTVDKKITEETQIKGHTAKATEVNHDNSAHLCVDMYLHVFV